MQRQKKLSARFAKELNNMSINRYSDKNPHAHNKGGAIGALKGLMETKHFGAKHGARHKDAKNRALKKARGESTDRF